MNSFQQLLIQVRSCTICAHQLAHGVRPVLQIDPDAQILIASQAPGKKVHASGVPFDDRSGDTLREWLGISREIFYNPKVIAVIPMGLCFPGTGSSGDLPPRPECAVAWREKLLAHVRKIRLTVVIGKYAHDYHLKGHPQTVTETVRLWQNYLPTVIPLPHPSPRNMIWIRRNPWFERDVIPALRSRVSEILKSSSDSVTLT